MSHREAAWNGFGAVGKSKATWPALTIFLAMIVGLLLGIFVGMEQVRSTLEKVPVWAGSE